MLRERKPKRTNRVKEEVRPVAEEIEDKQTTVEEVAIAADERASAMVSGAAPRLAKDRVSRGLLCMPARST